MMQAFRRAFMDDDSWYKKELTDMIKKGGSSVLAREKVEELKELLQQSNKTWSGLRQASELWQEVKGTCRSQKLASITSSFQVA